MLNTKKSIAVLFAGLFLATQANAQTGSDAIAIEGVELLESIGRYEHPLTVYKAAQPSSKAIAQRLVMANELPVKWSAEPEALGDNRLALQGLEDSSASFEIDPRTGNFMFELGLQKYGGEADTKGLPDAKQLPELAQKMLQSHGLTEALEELQVAHIGGLNLSVADGKTTPVIYEKLKTVRLQRVLDGVPVMGDSRVIMHFGEQAELQGMIYQIPEITSAEPLSSKLIQAPETLQKEALADLQAKAQIALRATLTKVDLVLYDDGAGIMEPAYHIEMERWLEVPDDKPTLVPYDFYLPVSSEPVAFFPDMEVGLFVPEGDGDSAAAR